MRGQSYHHKGLSPKILSFRNKLSKPTLLHDFFHATSESQYFLIPCCLPPLPIFLDFSQPSIDFSVPIFPVDQSPMRDGLVHFE